MGDLRNTTDNASGTEAAERDPSEMDKATKYKRVSIQKLSKEDAVTKYLQRSARTEAMRVLENNGLRKLDLAVIPMLQREAKGHLTKRQNEDETKAIEYLAKNLDKPSTASKVNQDWDWAEVA